MFEFLNFLFFFSAKESVESNECPHGGCRVARTYQPSVVSAGSCLPSARPSPHIEIVVGAHRVSTPEYVSLPCIQSTYVRAAVDMHDWLGRM